MRRLRVLAVALLIAGAAGIAAAAVRIGVLWIVEPGDPLVPVAALLLAAGLVAAAAALPALRRPFRASAALASAGLLLSGLGHLVAGLPLGAASTAAFVPYGPGTPPSISWTLLQGQVVSPALSLTAVALLVAALVPAIAGIARGVAARLGTA